MYQPSDELSTYLLESIPRKVAMWLFNLSVETKDLVFHTGNLKVEFCGADDNGHLIYNYGEPYGQDFVEIVWSNPGFKNVRVNHPLFAQAAQNLSAFVEIEQAIYNEMQAYQEKLEEERERLATESTPTV